MIPRSSNSSGKPGDVASYIEHCTAKSGLSILFGPGFGVE